MTRPSRYEKTGAGRPHSLSHDCWRPAGRRGPGQCRAGHLITAGQIFVVPRQRRAPAVLRPHGLHDGPRVDSTGAHLITVPAARELQLIEALSRNRAVEYAELDYVVTPASYLDMMGGFQDAHPELLGGGYRRVASVLLAVTTEEERQPDNSGAQQGRLRLREAEREHPQQHVLARHVPVPLGRAAEAQRLI